MGVVEMEDSGYRKSMILIAVLLVLMLITPAATHASAEPIGEDSQITEEVESAIADESSDDTNSVDDDHGIDVEYPENESAEGAVDKDEPIEVVDAVGDTVQVSSGTSSIDISNATIDPIPEQFIHDEGHWDDDSHNWSMWEDEDEYWEPSWYSSYSKATPLLHVYLNNKELILDVDYTVEYSGSDQVGIAKAIIHGIGGYTGTKQIIFRVSLDPAYNLANAAVNAIPDQYVQRERDEPSYYEEDERLFSLPRPDVVVRSNGTPLEPGKDYRCSQEVPDGAGTAKVTITGNGKYTGSITVKYRVRLDPAFDLSRATVSSIPNIDYSGEGITLPRFTVALDGVVLKGKDISDEYSDSYDDSLSGYDYTYSYECYPEPGLQKLTLVGCGQFAGKKVISFNVIGLLNSKYGRCYTPGILDDYTGREAFRIRSMKYTGKAITPKPVVDWVNTDWYDEDFDEYEEYAKNLKLNTDYTLSYKNNVNLGTATITVTGKGLYKGSFSKTFKIVYPIASASVSKIGNASYTGKAIKPRPTVKALGKTLKLGTDYTLSYKGNKQGGKATVTIKGKGLYTGKVSKTFKINVPMKYVKVAKVSTQVPLNKTIKPKPTVKLGSKKLKLGRDYTLSYKNNTKAGKATIIIRGKGYYRGTRKVSFTILPKGVGSTITKDEFNRIKKGMTYKEVVCLIGGKGYKYYSYSDDMSSYASFEWYGNSSYTYADIEFVDGRVDKKTQYGLR